MQMERESGARLEIIRSKLTGLATFVNTDNNHPLPSGGAIVNTPEQRGLRFLETYGRAFAIARMDQLKVRLSQSFTRDDAGMEHVRYQQVHRNVPVTGGEVIVHLKGSDVTSVTAVTLPDLEGLDVQPSWNQAQALEQARMILAKHLKVNDASLSKPRLEIFNRGLIDKSESPSRLAWFIEATKIDLREFIWIDAQTGDLLLRFSQLADAKSRTIYHANQGSTLPGSVMRTEGGAATGDSEIDRAYDFSGDTYDYFLIQHGRDSYDALGAALKSTVYYCPIGGPCPYQNAFWNGTQMVYGEGFSSADDVDAHELTHAVTERSANLVYALEPGALNESFSDIFGETVDLSNGAGTDSAGVRWQMGEDLPPSIGAIRNMMNPNLFGHPAKVSDREFICNNPSYDYGGVHINSGVPNHAYALMVDGGSYNGQSISGIGLVKAGKIQYRSLTQYLTRTSDFGADYNALRQCCTDLVGTAGITSSDCTQVTKALDAVEMNQTPCPPRTPLALPGRSIRKYAVL